MPNIPRVSDSSGTSSKPYVKLDNRKCLNHRKGKIIEEEIELKERRGDARHRNLQGFTCERDLKP